MGARGHTLLTHIMDVREEREDGKCKRFGGTSRSLSCPHNKVEGACEDMINRRKITERQAREAIVNGEFGEEVVASQKHVAMHACILKQSW